MLAAGLLAKKAVERGLQSKPWVKTSLAPGLEGRHRVLREAGLIEHARGARLPPRRLRLHDVHRQLGPAARGDLRGGRGRRPAVCAVLSGNRNFEGRINPDVRMNYLASPPLVVAYALAGTMDIDLDTEPLGDGRRRQAGLPARHLADPGGGRTRRSRRRSSRTCSAQYAEVFEGDEHWRALEIPAGDRSRGTTRRPTCATRRTSKACPRPDAGRATSRARACSPCSATGSPPTTSRPRARSRRDARPGSYLVEHGVTPQRLQLLRRAARQPRGDGARHVREHPPAQHAGAGHRGRRARCTCPSGEADDDLRRRRCGTPSEGMPLVVLAGKEYGTGSSRDWAAKGTEAARRARGDRRELRAHPPLEPRRHGRAAAAVRRRRDGRSRSGSPGTRTFAIVGIVDGDESRAS